MAPKNGDAKEIFDLIAVIVHRGDSPLGGHCTQQISL